MNSPDGIWQDFYLDENCVRVTDANRARLYLAQMSMALDGLRRTAISETEGHNAERKAIERFVTRLLQTFELLALRHFYGGESELKIDASDSGFFHFSTLVELAAELERRELSLAELPSRDALRREMLEQVVEHDLHPRTLQERMARRLYLEALAEEKLVRGFLPGPLEKVGREDDHASQFWSFATYDPACNLPFLYLLYFEVDGARRPLDPKDKLFRELAEQAERIVTGSLELLAFSNRIDHALPRIKPRIVKRLTLGPYVSPSFTRNEGEVGSWLDGRGDRMPFLLHFGTETLISARETRVGGGWLSRGQLRQVFWIPKEVDLAMRGVSQAERGVVMPAWLAQHAREDSVFDAGLRVLQLDAPGGDGGVA